MKLNVFNFNFERIGIIAVYQSAEFTLNYKKHSELELVVDATPENVDYFINNTDNVILAKYTDNEHGYIPYVVKYTDDTKSQIQVICKSLGYLLNNRLIDNQQTFSGTVEDTIRYFVTNNAVSPSNPNRVVPNLMLGALNGFTTTTTEAFANKYLDEALWEICIKFDIAYDILMDIDNKKFVFTVWQGVDRSDEQNERDAVIFSKTFGNVLTQNYTDDKTDYRNTVFIISGESEITQTQLIVNDSNTGWNRREVFVNASDLTNDDETVTNTILTERAKNTLATDYERVQSFETDVDYNSQYKYLVDYEMGDKVSIRNDDLGVVVRTRIVTAKEKYSKDGFDLSIEFGSNKPTLMSKLKKAVK